MHDLTYFKDENLVIQYFQQLYDIVNSGDIYPVDLDDVWMLKYSTKLQAIKELKKENWVENYDYQVFIPINARSSFDQMKYKYKLALECFEFFILDKHSLIFDLYMKIFYDGVKHKKIAPISEVWDPIEKAKFLIKETEKFLKRHNAQKATKNNENQLPLNNN